MSSCSHTRRPSSRFFALVSRRQVQITTSGRYTKQSMDQFVVHTRVQEPAAGAHRDAVQSRVYAEFDGKTLRKLLESIAASRLLWSVSAVLAREIRASRGEPSTRHSRFRATGKALGIQVPLLRP